jgi:hypothetical protein
VEKPVEKEAIEHANAFGAERVTGIKQSLFMGI